MVKGGPGELYVVWKFFYLQFFLYPQLFFQNRDEALKFCQKKLKNTRLRVRVWDLHAPNVPLPCVRSATTSAENPQAELRGTRTKIIKTQTHFNVSWERECWWTSTFKGKIIATVCSACDLHILHENRNTAIELHVRVVLGRKTNLLLYFIAWNH